jgi:hypothetical protein
VVPAGLRATYIGNTNQPASGRSKNRAIPTNQQEETMRRFMVRLVSVVDFEDGDEASDETVQEYQNHLRGMVQSAAQGVSLRTTKDSKVESVSVTEIKDEL